MAFPGSIILHPMFSMLDIICIIFSLPLSGFAAVLDRHRVFSVQGVYNHTNIYTQLSLRSNRTHAHITRCWCTLLQHYIAQVSQVCTIIIIGLDPRI